MDDQDRSAAQSIVNHSGLAQDGERVRSIGALQIEAKDHRARLEPVVAAENVTGCLALARQTLTDLLVLGSDPVRVTGQGFQNERPWMQATPFLPVRQQK